MPKERLSVRKIREVLKQKYERGRSGCSIAKSISVSVAFHRDRLPVVKGNTLLNETRV